MDSSSNSGGSIVTTPFKNKTVNSNRSKVLESTKCGENFNPNVSSPQLKSPSVKRSTKNIAGQSPNPNPTVSPLMKKKIRERKFVVAKKKVKDEGVDASSIADAACEKCGKGMGKSRCLCAAYERLRASHEEFFKNCGGGKDDTTEDFDRMKEEENGGGLVEKGNVERNDNDDKDESVANLKRSRERRLVEMRENVLEPGSGKVKQLVEVFEKLKVKGDECEENKMKDEDKDKGVKWALPGLQDVKVLEGQVSFSSSEFFLTSESLGLDPQRSYSLDSSQGSFSTRTSAAGQRSRRSSAESSGTLASRRHWKKKQRKATSQKPFMLRTEERGRCKEEEFVKKLRQMMEEEEKLRIPVAQGLPWTTDEPECLLKPPVKEITRPVDLLLHSDVRAVERAEFDHQVAEKMTLIEQYRMERERQQKLAEEEEIRRLRKELVPKAQPMPYFDRPFIPRRSMKNPTIPKEPKFHAPQHKKIKCYMSLDDLFMHQH